MPDPRFQVKKSTIPAAGKGLFAKKALKKGEILRVVGVSIPRHSSFDTCTRYADAYKFRVGNHVLIPLGLASFVNHSDKPNLKKQIARTQVHLETLRPIRKGEELVFRYSLYAQKRFL